MLNIHEDTAFRVCVCVCVWWWDQFSWQHLLCRWGDTGRWWNGTHLVSRLHPRQTPVCITHPLQKAPHRNHRKQEPYHLHAHAQRRHGTRALPFAGFFIVSSLLCQMVEKVYSVQVYRPGILAVNLPAIIFVNKNVLLWKTAHGITCSSLCAWRYPIPGWRGIPSLAGGYPSPWLRGIPCWPGQEGSHTWPGGVPYPGVQPVRTWVPHQEPPLWDQWKYYGKEMGYPRVWTDWKHYLLLYFAIIIFVNELHYLLPLLCSIKKWNNSWHRI